MDYSVEVNEVLTCKEVSYLASKKLDNKLSWRESLGIRMHVLMCGVCRCYALEINKLHSVIQKAGQSGLFSLPDSVILSKQSRARIKLALDKALHLP